MKDEGDIGLAVRLARVRRRRTQREVARQAGLRPSVLSEIECGWRKPTKDQLNRLACALGLDARDLCTSLDVDLPEGAA